MIGMIIEVKIHNDQGKPQNYVRLLVCFSASMASHQPTNQPQRFLPFALHVTDQSGEYNQRVPYRQVGIVAVTVVYSSYDPGSPRPPTGVADFRRLVPADTEEPLPDQLRPSLDCHGPTLVKPPLEKTSQQRRPYRSAIYDIKTALKNPTLQRK